MSDDVMFADLISDLVTSLRFCCPNLISDVACHLILPVKHWFHDAAAAASGADEGEEKEEEEALKEHNCSEGDVQVVMERLGMLDGWCCNRLNGVVEGVVEVMLEEKRASVEELREACGVFDGNEDGFISPGELWCVTRRLSLKEGLRLEACERMIRAFDEDGDGPIDFHEFTRLMDSGLSVQAIIVPHLIMA